LSCAAAMGSGHNGRLGVRSLRWPCRGLGISRRPRQRNDFNAWSNRHLRIPFYLQPQNHVWKDCLAGRQAGHPDSLSASGSTAISMKSKSLQTRNFDVYVPNLEGDGIAEIVPIEIQVWYDPDVGEEILTPESLKLIEDTKARRMGLMLPEEIKALRMRLRLTQHAISELLQLGEKSYTRWETGRARPSRSINVLLCALRDGHVTLKYLR